MKTYNVIDQLDLREDGLMCRKPSGKSWQKAHYKQGDLDGACGAYSVAMALNILGVFEAEDIYSDSDSADNRFADRRLIKALNEFGLFRDGLTSEQITEVLTKHFSKMVSAESFSKKEHDLKDIIVAELEDNNPVILRLAYNKNEGHWLVVIGYEQIGEKVTSLLTLDPGNESPSLAKWNGILDLEKLPKKIYGYNYYAGNTSYVDFDEAVVVSRK